MLILIDNYDSFTYNLVQYLGNLDVPCDVYRNDKITASQVIEKKPKGILISPGPGTPDDSGICLDLIKKAAKSDIPLFGVCLGHQALAQAFDANIIRANMPMHGKISKITHDNTSVFTDIPSPFKATRYHSLVIEKSSLPNALNITAQSDDGTIMGIAHKDKPLHAVQFHPESIATEYGHKLISNFKKIMS